MVRLLIFLLLISFQGFSQSSFKLDRAKSRITWKGSYSLGGYHEGTVNAASGYITTMPDGSIKGGDVHIDMQSITNTDITSEEMKLRLEDHLKSTDFFRVEMYPMATLSITNVQPMANNYVVTALLSMRGVVNEITFPATISIEEGVMRVRASTVIKRKDWGITYYSAGIAAFLKDGFVSDEIEIVADLIFQKYKFSPEELVAMIKKRGC